MGSQQLMSNGWQARWFHLALWSAIVMCFVLFLRAVQPILLPFVLGMLVAYLMDPLTSRIERAGLSRTAATAVVTLSFFSMLVALAIWLIPIVYEQLGNLAGRAPAMLQEMSAGARSWASPLLQKLNAISGKGQEAIPADAAVLAQRGVATVSHYASRIFSSGAALANVVALLLLTPVVCFYLIRDWPSVVKKVDAMLPLAYAPTIREQMRQINLTLASYLRGQFTVMFLLSVYYVVCFVLAGLHFGLAIGILAGCMVIIPYIGSLISIGLGLMVAYEQYYGTSDIFWFIVAVFVAGQVLESQVLTPKIIGDRVGLHPLWMLFGMLAGAVLLGFVGVLLAVPLTAVIGVLAKFAVSRYLQSGLYLDQ